MKKILLTFIVFLFTFVNIYAIDSSLIINKYWTLTTWETNIYSIPDWYDFYLESSSIQTVSNWDTATLTASDNWIIIFWWSFTESTTTNEWPRIYTNDLTIENTWNKDFSFVYNWYLFEENSFIETGSDNLGKSIFWYKFIEYFFTFQLVISFIILFIVFIIKFLDFPKKVFWFSTSKLSRKLVFSWKK